MAFNVPWGASAASTSPPTQSIISLFSPLCWHPLPALWHHSDSLSSWSPLRGPACISAFISPCSSPLTQSPRGLLGPSCSFPGCHSTQWRWSPGMGQPKDTPPSTPVYYFYYTGTFFQAAPCTRNSSLNTFRPPTDRPKLGSLPEPPQKEPHTTQCT